MKFSPFLQHVACVALVAFTAIASAQAGELQVREFPRATSSAISGMNFTDQPKQMPIDTRFSEAIQTVAFDLDMSCRQIEAYGWTLKPNEQDRVDRIFTDSAADLTRQGYLVKPQNPASAAADITVYTATRPATPNDHVLLMWSAGDAGLLLLMCDAKGSGEAPASTAATDTTAPAFADNAPYVDTNPTKLVGEWMGRYTCRSQGITGATLTITKAKMGSNHDNHRLDAVFSFYPTPLNQSVASGSYRMTGTYDETTQQAYFTPGQWLQHPPGYTTNPLMVYFDVQRQRLSGIFQDTTGCTSIEAGLREGSAATAGKEKKAKPKKKTVKKKPAAPKQTAPKETQVQVTDPAPEPESTAPLADAVADTVTIPETSGDVAVPVPETPAPAAPVTAPVTTPAVEAPKPVAEPAAAPASAVTEPALAVPTPTPTPAPVETPAAVPAAPAPNTKSVPGNVGAAANSGTVAMPVTKTLIVPQDPKPSVVDVMPKPAAVLDSINKAVDNSAGSLAVPPATAPAAQ